MTLVGIFAALLGATAYAINLVYARLASLQGFTPADMMLYPLLVLLVVLGVVIAFKPEKALVAQKNWGIVALMGAITGVTGLCFFVSVKYIPVSLAAMIVYSFPLIILLLTPFVEKRAIPLMYVALFLLAFVGLALVVAPSFEGLKWQGLVAAVSAAFLTAFQFFVVKRATAKVSSLTLVFYGHCVALPIVLVASTFLGGLSSFEKVSQNLWLVLIICSGYIMGYFMQLVAAKRLSPALSGLIFCFEPVVALITAWLVLGESLSNVQQAGAALVIGILVFTSYLDFRKPQL